MRTIITKVYKFDELSEQAKQTAIEEVRNEYYQDNDFASWAIDDCVLFEPKEKELVELLGEDYNFPLIENTRESIYFDTERNRFLDCEKAMVVTNKRQFLLWLGIDTNIEGLDEIEFNILRRIIEMQIQLLTLIIIIAILMKLFITPKRSLKT